MSRKHLISVCILSALFFISWQTIKTNWLTETRSDYSLLYTSADILNKDEYSKLIENGIATVKSFFGSSFSKPFTFYVHPNRNSLDSTWQKDWGLPQFKSECWMVASGVGNKLDMISPKRWETEACEHIYSEKEKTQQLITHELVHVYHGQLNKSHDFSATEGIDWFVEGLATFASGQCDSTRLKDVKKAIAENTIPDGLEKFWSGKIKYGLSGSVVMFIEHKYGRAKLRELLSSPKKEEVLSILKTTEAQLLADWKIYMQSL